MSQHVPTFLVLNLGSEMIFVIAHRLEAQNIPHERATLGISPKTLALSCIRYTVAKCIVNTSRLYLNACRIAKSVSKCFSRYSFLIVVLTLFP